MNSNELMREVQLPVVAVCAHLCANRHAEASAVLQMYADEKLAAGVSLTTVLDALVKTALVVAVTVADNDGDLFERLAMTIALEECRV